MRITFGKLESHRTPALRTPVLGLALAALFAAACAGGTSSTPGSGGSSSPGAAGNGTGGGNGGNSAAGNSGGGNAGTAGGSGGSAAGVAGNTGSAGNGTAGNLGTGGNSVGTGGNSTGGSATGTAGSSAGNVGTGGNIGTAGAPGGRGGSSAGSGGATAGSGGAKGGATGSAGATGSGGNGGSASAACPSNAIFCADFEETSGLPMNSPVGSATIQDPDEFGITFGDSTGAFSLDTSGAYRGKQSLKVSSPGSFHYRTLSVSVPKTFWVRLHMKSDHDIGQPDHNAFFAAMTDPNYHTANVKSVEFSEQYTCLNLHQTDSNVIPPGTTCTTNSALPQGVWHCIEAEFDGTTGTVQIYANGTLIINAPSWAPAVANFNTFEFGYMNYNAPGATIWYDDVAIATSRINCP